MDTMAVSFPNMGLNMNISRVAFTVFGQPIYWYGIIIALAFLVCVLWAMKDSTKFGLVPDTVIDLMLFAAPIAIVCARLYYVIFSWDSYRDNLLQIFNIRNGGLAIYGGIIGAIVTAYFVARHKKIPTFKFFDFAIPYVALGQGIGRWGNFFNQEAFGTNTSLPWGMTSPAIKSYLSNNASQLSQYGITVDPNLPVHPTFLYESIWDILIFAFLLWMRRKKKFDGEVFCFYFITYSLGRAFIEGLRTDSLMLGHLRISQVLSVLLVIAFTIFVIYKRSKLVNNIADAEVGNSAYSDLLKKMEEEERIEAEAQAAENTGEKEETAEGSEDEAEEEPGATRETEENTEEISEPDEQAAEKTDEQIENKDAEDEESSK